MLNAGCLGLLLTALGAAGCTSEATESVLPPATVRTLMRGKTVPAANVLFAVADQAPADPAGWREVERSALALAEVGARLQNGTRGAGRAQWAGYSQAMADGARRAARAAGQADAEAVSVAGNDVYAACEACHKAFFKKTP
jgi:hypothetical protein